MRKIATKQKSVQKVCLYFFVFTPLPYRCDVFGAVHVSGVRL